VTGGLRRRSAVVRVPATSANLGCGFDSFGLALNLHDEVSVRVIDGPVTVAVTGHGAGTLPSDGRHLVARTIIETLTDAGVTPPGLHIQCVNRIPHGRGLGSSAAALTAGVLLGQALIGEDAGGAQRAALQAVATAEGHPDNAAACLLGGFTIAWREPAGGPGGEPAGEFRARSLPVHPSIRTVVCIPRRPLPTRRARRALATEIGYAEATFNIARAGLLVHALGADPSLLVVATDDRMHQQQRAALMPDTLALVARLRAAGLAAMVSGAGPTVLTLVTAGRQEAEVRRLTGEAMTVQSLSINRRPTRPRRAPTP